jgi:hypothetical protein
MGRDAAYFRKLAALAKQLAGDCRSDEARRALLRTPSEMESNATATERLQDAE